MVCMKCKYEFCWVCMGHYKNYHHDPGMDIYCRQAGFTKAFIFIVATLCFFIKLGIRSNAF